jgi:hypothetical protein
MSTAVLGRKVSENDFQRALLEAAHLYHWRVCHFRAARTKSGWRTPIEGDPGLPDLILARDGVVIMAELKSDDGILAADQEEWLRALGPFGRLWRPKDMPAILRELARPRRRHTRSG